MLRRSRRAKDSTLCSQNNRWFSARLGIAVGALIVAALPSTEQGDRLLGPVRDRTLSEVKERGAESYNQVRESVSRVGEEAKQAISGSGKTSHSSNEPHL
jgi:hypothetical protein